MIKGEVCSSAWIDSVKFDLITTEM